MKAIRSMATWILGLLALGLLVILLNFLFSSARQEFAIEDAQVGSSPNALATLIPPIQVSKLHVVKQTRVDDKLECGQKIAIAPDSDHFICPNVRGGRGVWLGSFSKGLERQLAAHAGYARWFPNGKNIVYAIGVPPGHTTSLYQLNTETGNQIHIGTTTNASHLQVLRTGKVFFIQKQGLQVWDAQTKISRSLAPEGSTAQTQTQRAFSGTIPTSDSDFTISPDGRYMAVQGVFYEQGTLTLNDLNTGDVITVTNQIGNSTRPMAWSLDSRQLAYSIQDNAHRSELWLVGADGTNSRQVWQATDCTSMQFLTWMPDGQTLLFVCNHGGTSFEVGWDYMAINTNGGSPQKLFTNGEGLDLFDSGSKILILRSVEAKGNWVIELAQ